MVYTEVQKRKIERERLRKWSRIHIESERERKRNYAWVVKFRALQIISKRRIPCCIKCGIKDLRILTVNHLYTISEEENDKYPAWLYYTVVSGKRKINDLEVRCNNCNISYEYERGRLNNVNKLRLKALYVISRGKQPKCKKCRETDLKLLNTNHINGSGNSNGKIKAFTYKDIIKKGKKGFDIRCWNCNILYEFEQKRRFFNRKAVEKILKKKKFIRQSDSLKPRRKYGRPVKRYMWLIESFPSSKRTFRSKHKEKSNEYRRRYAKKHPEYERMRQKRWQQENPEKYREMCQKWREKNREKIRIRDLKHRTKMMRNGLCISCGKKNDSEKSKYLCQKCCIKRNIQTLKRKRRGV